MLTAVTQRARSDMILWLLGSALSMLAFAAIQARAMVAEGVHDDDKGTRLQAQALMGALALAGILIVAASLPSHAPHGLLLALVALPLALVAVTGLWRSTFAPARALAARRAGAVFTLAAFALIAGALASIVVTTASAMMMKMLGG
jgi:hypothetical protein